MTTAVIFNDTRIHGHFGCDRVMTVLETNLARRGVQVTATSPVRHIWWEDAALLQKVAEADLVVINGEGTLHHGSNQGASLMRLVGHPQSQGKPLFLINALYQENPADWSDKLRHFAGIWARDSRSAAAMSAATGRTVGHFGDLTLCDGSLAGPAERHGVVIGDSVKTSVSRRLAQLSRAVKGAQLVPIVRALKSVRDRQGLAATLRRIEDRVVTAVSRLRYPGLRLVQDEASYARIVSAAALHVTGRFHGACFSIATETPFISMTSNSWKIEAMIEDCGLSPERIVTPDRIGPDLLARDWAFSAAELAGLRAYVERSGRAASAAFDAIAASV